MRLPPLWFVLPILLAGCATPLHKEVSSIRAGMDKDEVLAQAGDPRRTFRADGQDHWIYVFQRDDHELLQQIDFEQGKVVRVGSPKAKEGSQNDDLESAETFEEFEQRAKARQRKR